MTVAHRLRSGLIRAAIVTIVLLLITVGFYSPAYAGPPANNYYAITVSSSNDTASGGSACTLRDAIGIVNAGTTSGTVNGCVITTTGSPSGLTYVLTLPSYTYTLNGSELIVAANISYLVGQGAANTVLQANAAANTA